MQNHLYMFRETGSRRGGTLHLFVIGTSEGHTPDVDFAQDDGWFLKAFAVPLKPGRYEIHDLEISAAGGSFSKPRGKFSLPFEIKPGRVSYVGSFVAEAFMGQNFMRQPVLGGIAVMLTDEHDRDITFLQGRNALPVPLPPVDIEIAEVTSESGGGGIVVRHHGADGAGIKETSLPDTVE